MSYILDALKKSDMQARRGELPSIHSSHAPAAPPRRPGWHYAVFGGGAAVVVLGAAWFMAAGPGQPPATGMVQPAAPEAAHPTSRPATPPPVPAHPAAAPALLPPPHAATRSAVPATLPAPAPQPITAPPAPQPALPPTTQATSPVTPPATHASTPTPPHPAATPIAAPAAPTPATPAKPVGNAPAATTATTPEAPKPLPLLGQLPVNVQQAMPRIDISGHIYDKNPANRMVFINGHIAHEGSTVAPGLQLLAIVPDGVVMSFRGTRFRIRLFGAAQAGH